MKINTAWHWVKKHKRWISFFCLLTFLGWYWFALPKVLFEPTYATVLLDRNGELLGARIAADGQWRFPELDTVPVKIESCLLEFEDRTFYQHLGISARGVSRALVQNVKRGKVVSGASTITMQTMRLFRKNPSRTFFEKLYEMVLATRLELSYSKKEILNLYCSHAPFGNNVVGLNAASWRYFGKDCAHLSWAESATLAVLPNAPGLIYPGKNHQRLLLKRNRLLTRLLEKKCIDSTTYRLALAEPLPGKPLALPQLAPHLLQYFVNNGRAGVIIHSTIDKQTQLQAAQQLQNQMTVLNGNKIFNGALLITEVKSGNVMAYIGNSVEEVKEHANEVDCIQAPRSTGSVLKPILYERCLESGLITPQSLIADIPVQYGNFSPKNYYKTYDGAVTANEALSRSLNIPMIKLLNDYGLSRFHYDLRKMGLKNINRSATNYGLSLILGGAEISVWELNLLYADMARRLSYQNSKTMQLEAKHPLPSATYYLDKACVSTMFDAMTELNRPDEEGNWKAFESSKTIAWKTGTSFGNRDAWCVGITPDYVITVWVGNANGEGRTGLTGLNCAAPILFELFSQLKSSGHWFAKAEMGFEEVELCKESGYRATRYCTAISKQKVPKTCLAVMACPYHKPVAISKRSGLRVDADCEEINQLTMQNFMVLPPLIEKYYVAKHPEYKRLPPFDVNCNSKINEKAMTLIYPKPNAKIIIPREIDGQQGKVIVEASHKNSTMKIYWHLDENYLGETTLVHQWPLNPEPGKHTLTLIDENGVTISTSFEVIKSKK